MNGLKYFWIGFCFCFITVAFFSENYIAFHWDHDCYGAGCPVCFLIQRAENFSRQLRSAASYSGFSESALLTAVFILRFALFCFIILSSVRLKIKMNR
jgi:hypothetical protein